MLDKFKDMGKALKQAKEMKGMMEDVQKELQKLVIPVEQNGVKIEITGELEVKSISLDPSILGADKKSTLESSLVSATNKAVQQAKDIATNKLQSVTGGLFGGDAPAA